MESNRKTEAAAERQGPVRHPPHDLLSLTFDNSGSQIIRFYAQVVNFIAFAKQIFHLYETISDDNYSQSEKHKAPDPLPFEPGFSRSEAAVRGRVIFLCSCT
jgi:hypothetical protein